MTSASKDHLNAMMRTIYGEARGEDWMGMIAVAHVILNRVKAESWWGRDIEEVCHFAWQFSCWNESDPNLPALKRVSLTTNPSLRLCLAASAAATWGLEPDPTGGCCHYMTKARREQGWPKSWGDPIKPHKVIGTHLFYKGIP